MLRKAGIAFMLFGLTAGVGASVSAQDAACDEMLVRGNIQRVIDEGFNQGNVAVVDELFTEDFMSQPDGFGRTEFSGQISALRGAMPSSTAAIDHLLVEGCDAFFTFHQGGVMESDLVLPGQPPIASTGADLNVEQHVYLRLNESGQIVEQWTYSDSLSFMTEAGLLPNPAGEMPLAEATAEAGMSETIMTTGNETGNADTVRQVFEGGFNIGDTEAVRGFYAPDYMGHDVSGNMQSVDQLFGSFNTLRTALPDAMITVNDTVAQGDYVATRVTISGTFQNEFTGMDGQPVAPTGGPVSYEASFLHRLTPEGLIAEEWVAYDQVGFMAQMGMSPVWGPDLTLVPDMDMTAEATADAG